MVVVGADAILAWARKHPRLLSAVAIAAGVPTLIVAWLGVTLATMWTLQTRVLAPDSALAPWLWLVGLSLVAIPLWWLVVRCLKAGGWVGVGLGLGALVVAALSSWLLGSLESALYPQSAMAGIGPAILAALLVMFAVAVAVMAAVAARLEARRGQPPA